jgi:hypothetical protein
MRHRLMIACGLGAILLLGVCFVPVSGAESRSAVAAPEGATVTPTNTSVPRPTNTPTPTACTIEFSDVPPGNTFYPYVRCLVCRGLVSGYADGTFRPNNDVTRGQLCKMVVNAAEFYEPIPPDRQSFEDVQPGSSYWVYIERLAARGLVRGYVCGSNNEPCVPPQNRPYFRPGSSAVRGQVAKIVSTSSMQGDPIPPWQRTFEDVTNQHTYWLYAERLANRNIVNGYSCGGQNEPCVPPHNRPYYRPYIQTTRGQAVKIVASSLLGGCHTP